MKVRKTCYGLGVLAVLYALQPAAHGGGAKPAKDNLNSISLEVKALKALDGLDLKPKQLQALAALAKETAMAPRKRTPAKVSPEYRKTLHELHEALVKKDDEKVTELEGKLEDLEEKESPELDTDVDVTAAARQKAPEVVKLLSAAQVSAFLGTTDISDPLEVLGEALENGAGQKGEEWKETRDEAAEEVGNLLGGLNEAHAKEFAVQATKLLNKAHAAGQTAVSEEMEQMVAKVGPFQVLRNGVEHALAELLSNPRLSAAIQARKAD